MYRAVLDTCVLVPDLQRDFLLQVAAEHGYTAMWGSGILTELEYVLRRLDAKRGEPDRKEARQRLLRTMDAAFPGSTIEAPKSGRYDYGLRDPDDGHVAHAAIIGKADAIVTDDRRSGLSDCSLLREASVDILSARDFATNTAIAHRDEACRALLLLAERRRQPPQTPLELLVQLRDRHNLVEVYEFLSPLLAQ